jgi:hypothetical protein
MARLSSFAVYGVVYGFRFLYFILMCANPRIELMSSIISGDKIDSVDKYIAVEIVLYDNVIMSV